MCELGVLSLRPLYITLVCEIMFNTFFTGLIFVTQRNVSRVKKLKELNTNNAESVIKINTFIQEIS